MQKFSRGKTACPKILEWRMKNILVYPNFLDVHLQTPNSILSKSSMDNMQNSTSIAKDTGKHPGDGSGGGSDGGEVDDSNDDNVQYH